MEDLKGAVAKNLASLRKQAGLTQAELAEEQTEVLEENEAPAMGLTM